MGRLAAANRLGQSAFDRPATKKSLAEHTLLKAQFAFPHGERHGAAQVRQFMNMRPSVVGLNNSRRPAAVARLISKVIVNAVDTQTSLRGWSHVGEERLEGFSPTLAHRDASSTVSAISGITRVVTAFLQVRPTTIFLGSGSAMSPQLSTHSVSKKAATTSGHTIGKSGTEHGPLSSAGAQTKPVALFWPRCSSKCCPASEHGSREIQCWPWHHRQRITVTCQERDK